MATASLQLYCTFTRSLRTLVPLKPLQISMYCCGPTVYDFAHIGNLRTYLNEDFLRRTFEICGYGVEHVMNITDVGHLTSDADEGEDKMEKGSARTGKTAWQIADEYTKAFFADCGALNIKRPHQTPRATDYITQQIETVQKIEAKGFSYLTDDGVYFDTSKLSDYGELARLDIKGLREGLRVDFGSKRNKTDFALWKFSAPGSTRQMEWDSPWGKGFPGWHIECTAMSVALLGDYFDVHWGGEDHIPVHHTNEIAQCQAAHGTRAANFWLHAKFLNVGSEKMSKSSGADGFLRLQTILDKGFHPLSYRYLCLSAHYRAALEFTWENLQAAETSLKRLSLQILSLPDGGQVIDSLHQEFLVAIANDLGVATGLGLAWKWLKDPNYNPADIKSTLLAMDKVFGLKLGDPKALQLELVIPTEVQNAAEARKLAKTEKRFLDADEQKKRIQDLGFDILDTPQGYELRPKR
jgi:cysteinyl-tRNA synthetase